MRFLVVMLVLSIALAAAALPIEVPGEHTYLDDIVWEGDPPDTVWVYATETIRSIQDGVDLAIMLTYEHPFAGQGYPGFVDTVLIMSGSYDSVHAFNTPLGIRDAIVGISDDITLLGADGNDVEIDHREAEYGILLQNVSRSAIVSNLMIVGGDSRDQGLLDDGDGRNLAAGICCVDAASPTITDVSIENSATGIVVRTESGSADSAPIFERVVVARGSHNGLFIYRNGTQPVIVERCTFVDNFDYGVYVNGGAVEIHNTAITNNGNHGIHAYLAMPDISYCNVYCNDRISPGPGGPQNYGGSLDDLEGFDGNISSEPWYCDFFGGAGYDYHVCASDSISPHIDPGGEGGVTIGALDAVCTGCQSTGCEPSPVEPTTWGAIKAMYR